MTFNIPDDLSIPAFLHREPTTEAEHRPVKPRRRKIDYPKDGYACKGARQETREKHRERLRRRAEKMRTPPVRGKRRGKR